MDKKTQTVILISLIAGLTIGEPTLNAIKAYRAYRKLQQWVQTNVDLDHLAVARANEKIRKDMEDGLYDGLTYDQVVEKMQLHFDFEMIAARL